MSSPNPPDPETSRARAWIHHEAEQVPQIREPWAHGTIYRDDRYPQVAQLNYIRVCERPAMSAEDLYEAADEHLREYDHRHLHFDSEADAAPFRDLFRERGYMVVRLTWMHFEGARPDQPRDPRVREVEYEIADPLRRAWHREDFGDDDPTEYLEQVNRLRAVLSTRTLAIFADTEPVAFASLNLGEDGAEIGGLYALPEYRGRGLGTALARCAISELQAEHLWICADEDDRPKRLYARLGFRPVLTTAMFLRIGQMTD